MPDVINVLRRSWNRSIINCRSPTATIWKATHDSPSLAQPGARRRAAGHPDRAAGGRLGPVARGRRMPFAHRPALPDRDSQRRMAGREVVGFREKLTFLMP